jgi:hypothetical protein
VHPGLGHPGEQHRCGQVVVADVRREVAQVDAHAHHRGLMHDDIHAPQSARDDVSIPEITHLDRNPAERLRQRSPVCRRMTAVEDRDGVARREQRSGHVGSDETGAAGQKYVGHGGHGRPRRAGAEPFPGRRQHFVRTASDVTIS